MKTKKKVMTGIILILVLMLLGTCDAIIPVDEEVEYTDVVYSTDAAGRINEVTLYIDGVGVPVTKSMRAINRELATMAYDYFEVVFTGATDGAVDTARAAWELGQPAGIYNVPRGTPLDDPGTTAKGINYAYTNGTATNAAARGNAVMFVGKKDGKTLLGIGFLTGANNPGTAAGALPQTVVPTAISNQTTRVTFHISAIQSGLLVSGETLDGTAPATAVPGVMANSFTYTSAAGYTSAPNYTALSATNSFRKEPAPGASMKYPVYLLPDTAGGLVYATYTFSYIYGSVGSVLTLNAGNTPWDYVKLIRNNANSGAIYDVFGVDGPLVQKRVPRYMEGGRYREPRDRWTTTTKVELFNGITATGNYSPPLGSTTVVGTGGTPPAGILHGGSFNAGVGLRFTTQGSGVFSFFIQIPVFALTPNNAEFEVGAANSIKPEKWYIRTGVGSELYSLDDGIANGGCVFMSVGQSSSNWIDIEWQWL